MSVKKLLVAAIDFGTTYSGWACSFRHEFEADPTKIHTKQWTSGRHFSQKTPTCVLIKPDGKTFHSFGYEAENKYAKLAEDGDHGAWYLFQRFKMMLFDRVGLERDILISDATDKQLPATRVFSLAIGYLKDDLLNVSRDRITDIQLDDIHWVLTVPAIWKDSAKQFMRECAVNAGINSDNLSIALEPEAASLYCRHIPVEKNKGTGGFSLASFPHGSKYLVLDAGECFFLRATPSAGNFTIPDVARELTGPMPIEINDCLLTESHEMQSTTEEIDALIVHLKPVSSLQTLPIYSSRFSISAIHRPYHDRCSHQRTQYDSIHVNPTYEKHLEFVPDFLSTRELYCEVFRAEENTLSNI